MRPRGRAIDHSSLATYKAANNPANPIPNRHLVESSGSPRINQRLTPRMTGKANCSSLFLLMEMQNKRLSSPSEASKCAVRDWTPSRMIFENLKIGIQMMNPDHACPRLPLPVLCAVHNTD